MVSGCSGIINDRVYAVTPSNNYYTLDSTLLNGTTLGNNTGCPPVTSFTYSTCTVINSPPTIVMVGTDAHGVGGTRLLQFSSNGSCQLSDKWYSTVGMAQPLSVVPASCDTQTSIPCIAVLGLSSTTHQYIIQYPTSLSFNGSNSITVGLGDSTIHPVLALPPNDGSKIYVVGYPTKDQILILQNGNNQASIPSSAVPSLFTTTTNALSTPPPTDTKFIFARAEPTHVPGLVNTDAGSYIKMDAAIENAGPAITVGNNIVIVSSGSLSVEVISSLSSSSSILPVAKLSMPPSSQVQNANSMKGIDSLTPLPIQNGDLSTIWISYGDGIGNHLEVSSQQPGLFGAPTGTGSGTPGSETSSTDSAAPSLSPGAIAGIVIGSIVGFILLSLLCFYLWRRQRRQNKRQRQRMNGDSDNRDISLMDQRYLTEKTASTPTTYVSTPIKYDSTSIIAPIGHEYHHHSPLHDDRMDDTPPLTSLTRQINHYPSAHDDTYYEPTSTNELLLESSSGYYLHNEPPSYAIFPQGYATRQATRTHTDQTSIECTIHYFPASCAGWVRHLLHTNAGLQAQHRIATASALEIHQEEEEEPTVPNGLQIYDAITLSQPTQRGHYQYIWITSPFHLQNTLQALLFGGSNAVVDCSQFSFKAWSTLSMLKSLESLHQSGWVHRKLNPSAFFYDQASSVTEWRLVGFYQSIWYTGLVDKVVDVQWDECSAPECIDNNNNNNNNNSDSQRISVPSMDIWSLGCVLYSVATGKRAFQHLNEYQALLRSSQLQAKVDALIDEAALIDDSYKYLLRRMLQIHPGDRDTLQNIISYWIQANQLDDDE